MVFLSLTDLQILNFDVEKKLYKLSKLEGREGKVIWTKSKRTAAFFRETFPKKNSQIFLFLINLILLMVMVSMEIKTMRMKMPAKFLRTQS